MEKTKAECEKGKEAEGYCLFEVDDDDEGKVNGGKVDKDSVTWCGKCMVLFFILICAFFVWTIIALDFPYPFDSEDSDPPLVLENDRLPMISQDRKIIYVASEEGLPVAHNFILRNPSIPIEKIVFRKPGQNSSLHVYQIQRDALWATGHTSLSSSDIPALCSLMLMLTSIVTVMYIFTCKDWFGQVADQSALEGLEEFYSLYFDTPTNSPMPSPVKPVPKTKNYPGKNAKELEPLLTV